ncbi:unnamed protein product [Chrysoparadoxa australica]
MMALKAALGLGLVAGAYALPQDVTVVNLYTKESRPFAFLDDDGAARGYTTTIMTNVLEEAFENLVTINTVFVASNEDIFQAVEAFDYNANPTEYAIGAASISVTEERETRLDFLPSYFKSGIQVLARTSESSYERIKALASAAINTLGVIILALLFLILMLTPLVWFLETAFCGDEVSCFHVSDAETVAKGKKVEVKAQIMREFINAAIWTTSLMAGAAVGLPKSPPVKIIATVLKIMHTITVVVATATVTTLFTTAALKSDINSYDDLVGKTVCTVGGTEPDSFASANNRGFEILRATSIDGMMNNFWESQCDAVVYDFPILAYAVVERQAAGLLAPAALVGQPLNSDPYGAVVTQDSPLLEPMRLAMISQIRDANLVNNLNDQWFGETASAEGEEEGVPPEVFWVPVVIAFGLLLIASYWFYKNHEEIHDRRQEFDSRDDTTDYNFLIYQTLKKGKADITFRDAADLIHEMASEQRDIKRLLCTALLLLDPTQERKEIEELREIYAHGLDNSQEGKTNRAKTSAADPYPEFQELPVDSLPPSPANRNGSGGY